MNGTPFKYEVRFFQWIDPEGGIQLWIIVSLDAGYNVTDVTAFI